jgi:hypothetical protein
VEHGLSNPNRQLMKVFQVQPKSISSVHCGGTHGDLVLINRNTAGCFAVLREAADTHLVIDAVDVDQDGNAVRVVVTGYYLATAPVEYLEIL